MFALARISGMPGGTGRQKGGHIEFQIFQGFA